MTEFRRFYVIQCRSTGAFLTEELGYTNLAEKAGRLYCPHEAVDTARLNLDDDYAIKTINGFTDHHTPENLEQQTEKVINPAAQPYAPARPQYVKEEPTWLEARQERVPGLPYTAPVYDKLTEPITVPVPAACVDFRGQCKCYSQQGTPVATSEYLCKQIIQGGMFVDFNPGQSANELSQQAERERLLADQQRRDELRRRDLERAASEARITDSGNSVAPASVDVRQPQADEVRSPSLIARERTAASQWAFNPNSSN